MDCWIWWSFLFSKFFRPSHALIALISRLMVQPQIPWLFSLFRLTHYGIREMSWKNIKIATIRTRRAWAAGLSAYQFTGKIWRKNRFHPWVMGKVSSGAHSTQNTETFLDYIILSPKSKFPWKSCLVHRYSLTAINGAVNWQPEMVKTSCPNRETAYQFVITNLPGTNLAPRDANFSVIWSRRFAVAHLESGS